MSPIAARKAMMKANGDQAKIGSAMVKGEAPFDLVKAKAIFVTFVDAAGKVPNLFPENSKTGGETAATPKIWEDTADFKAKFVKFGADAKAAEEAVKDLDSFKAEVQRYFPVVAGSDVQAFAGIAGSYPVFELLDIGPAAKP